MTTSVQAGRPALAQRLRVAAAVLAPELEVTEADPFAAAGTILDALVRTVRADPGGGRLWLLLVALTGRFPLFDEYEEIRRILELNEGIDALQHLLHLTLTATDSAHLNRTIRLVTDRPLVDVHFTAGSALLTGIQRVVQHTVPRWRRTHDLELCTWTVGGGALRELSSSEHTWMMERELLGPSGEAAPAGADGDDGTELLVPWRVPVLLPEVPSTEHAPRLSALARLSGSPVALIGYDCIPVVSGELVVPEDHAKFVTYLNVVKYAERVVCISAASAEEFAGFGDALGAQGLPGPRILICPLPNGPNLAEGSDRSATEPAGPGSAGSAGSGVPTVVCVGSIDRRKNQIVVLEAAEQLWRQGHRFALRFLGSGGLAPADFTEWVDELIAAGRPVTIETEVTDATLAAAVGSARFTAFLSLHEGFGLPVVESLAMGVPVLTSDVGSLRELAADDGAVTVDPTDVVAVTDAMRRLLTDDELHAELVARARGVRRRGWDEYSDQAWEALVGGAREDGQ